MKLFFCDICNESIPLQDIKENRSTTIKGKIFCRSCNPLNELPSSDASGGSGGLARGGGSAAVGLLGVLVLGLAGAVGYLYYDLKVAHPVGASPSRSAEFTALSDKVDLMNTALKGLQVGYDGLAGLQSVPEQLDGIRDEANSRAGELTRLSTDMKAIQEQLVAVGNLRERVEGMVLRQDETGSRLNQALSAIESVRGDLRTLGDRPPVIVERAGNNATSDIAATASDPPDEALLAIIQKLSSDDAMVRWEAVDQIRRRKDVALTPHVMGLLDDRDTFVRAQAIYTLGDLKAMAAVPKLIKLLRDDETMIAEEALASLVGITGQNLSFDVTASKGAREKGIRRWEEWAEKNKELF